MRLSLHFELLSLIDGQKRLDYSFEGRVLGYVPRGCIWFSEDGLRNETMTEIVNFILIPHF